MGILRGDWGSSGVTADPHGCLGLLPCYSVCTRPTGCRVPSPANHGTTNMPYPGWGRGSQKSVSPSHGTTPWWTGGPKVWQLLFWDMPGTWIRGEWEACPTAHHPHHHLSSVKVLWMPAQSRTCWGVSRVTAQRGTLTVKPDTWPGHHPGCKASAVMCQGRE